MNPYAAVILSALLIEFLLGRSADLLNLKALRPDPPEELKDVYDLERYRRSQEYTRARSRFSLLPETLGLVALLAFWGLGGFAALDGWLAGYELGPIPTGLAYIGLLVLAQSLLGLPFALWSTFVIEERFGFNRMTAKTFWADRLKGLLLGVALGGPLLALILFFLERAGDSAWLWCWGVCALFVLTVQLLAPTLLLPLFLKFTPLGEGELRSALLGFAERVAFPLSDVFVVDGSRRSTKANAFFSGLGRNRRVALFDTLIEKQSSEELVAVVAHEIGHFKHRHILFGTLQSVLHLGLLFGLLGVFLRSEGLASAFGIETPSTHTGLVFFGLLYTPIEMLLGVVTQWFSRRHEFQADAYAARTTGKPESLVSALKKLAAENLSNLTPHPLAVFLYHSHPPVLQRIRALRQAHG